MWTDAAGIPLDSTTYNGLPYSALTSLRNTKDFATYISGYDSTNNYSVSRIDSSGQMQWR